MESAREPLLTPDAEAGCSSPPPTSFRSGNQHSTLFSPSFGPHPSSVERSTPAPGSAFRFPPGSPGPQRPPPRSWRGPLLACCGRCSSADCHAGWLACLLPCVAWAHNQHRAFAVAFLPQLMLYLLLVYALRSAAVTVVASCELREASKPSAGCHAASMLTASSYWAIASAFSLFAAWRRAALRRRFGISGSACGDATAWLCCPACALCQETRTLAHNRVEGGFWLGPLQPAGAGGAVSGYDDAAAYPYDYVPTSYGSPPPPQRAGREAQPFTAVGVPAAMPPGTFIVPPPQPPCSS